MEKIFFLIGGARSGKSQYAEILASSITDKVLYFATAKITDDEMKKRVETHKKRRPALWKTLEIENDFVLLNDIKKLFDIVVINSYELILIDCITNLLFRLIQGYKLDNLEIVDNKLEKKIESEILLFFEDFVNLIVSLCKKNNLNIILVSNEVGLGVIPPYPLGRVFRDLLGLVNKKIASVADEVYFFVAGLKLKMK